MNILKALYYFNYYFIYGTGFNIKEEILAIFITESVDGSNLLTLSFLISDTSPSEIFDDALNIVQEFEDILYYKKHIEYNYNTICVVPDKSKILCSLFSWHQQNYTHTYLNFFNYQELNSEKYEDKLRATLTQLLVNRIVINTRFIRCLYDKETLNIEFSCIHYGNEEQLQTDLLQQLIEDFKNITTINIATVSSIRFDGKVRDSPHHIRLNEWALFTKYDDIS